MNSGRFMSMYCILHNSAYGEISVGFFSISMGTWVICVVEKVL